MHPYNIAYVKLMRSRSDDTALNVNRRLTLTEPSPIKVILKSGYIIVGANADCNATRSYPWRQLFLKGF